MASVFEQAGVPAGCVQILPGIGRELGPVLTRHPETRAISLTGSIRTGREVMREGAEGIKRVLLELGGNAPFKIGRAHV